MKLAAIAVALLLPLVAGATAAADDEFDFFYFVQQWPGSFCDTDRGCCFPDTGKPAAEFGIHGLWPNYAKCRPTADDGPEAAASIDMVVDDDGSHHHRRRQKCWPEYCNNSNNLHPWEIKDLIKDLDANWPTLSCKGGGGGSSMEFWAYEWKKHGTCSGLGQHDYFAAALDLKRRDGGLAGILAAAGIVPSEDERYLLSGIRGAIANATGAIPNLECNRDAFGETQLYQVYQCVSRDGRTLVDCLLPMSGKCSGTVKLPPF
uniref:Uncharacterized protein n=1 Tax=Leersia perrieri TaxID=77586 RepID=A0A0D9X1T7_9ORYZ